MQDLIDRWQHWTGSIQPDTLKGYAERAGVLIVLALVYGLLMSLFYFLHDKLLTLHAGEQIVKNGGLGAGYVAAVLIPIILITYIWAFLSTVPILLSPYKRWLQGSAGVMKSAQPLFWIGAVIALVSSLLFVALIQLATYSRQGRFLRSALDQELNSNLLTMVFLVQFIAMTVGYNRAYYAYRLYGVLSMEDNLAIIDAKRSRKYMAWNWDKMKIGGKKALGYRIYSPGYFLFTIIFPLGVIYMVGLICGFMTASGHIIIVAMIVAVFQWLAVMLSGINAKLLDHIKQNFMMKALVEEPRLYPENVPNLIIKSDKKPVAVK